MCRPRFTILDANILVTVRLALQFFQFVDLEPRYLH
jgi:hypothetical protein